MSIDRPKVERICLNFDILTHPLVKRTLQMIHVCCGQTMFVEHVILSPLSDAARTTWMPMNVKRVSWHFQWHQSIKRLSTWDNLARKAISLALGALSPPSDSRRTWLAIMPLVHCMFGNECFRVSRGSRNGDNRYGFSGESLSSSTSSSIDFGDVGSFSSSSDSSTTIRGSSTLTLNAGVNDARRMFVSFLRFAMQIIWSNVSSLSLEVYRDARLKKWNGKCVIFELEHVRSI